MDEKIFATYEGFKKTDFWSGLHITEAEEQKEGNRKVITLNAGWFDSDIDLRVTTEGGQQICRGELSVRRRWISGPPYGLNPMALDTVRSFIEALIPLPDRGQVAGLLRALAAMQDPDLTNPLLREGPRKSWLHEALFTYLGPATSCRAPFDYSDLSMANITREDGDWLQLVISVAAPPFDPAQGPGSSVR